MKNKVYQYNNGYKIKCPIKSNDFINRKIFSKDNNEYEKIYIPKNEFALWNPTIDDLPDFINSISFFGSIRTNDEKAMNDAQEKMYYLLMKMGEIPEIKPARVGDCLDDYINEVKKSWKENFKKKVKSSPAIALLRKN